MLQTLLQQRGFLFERFRQRFESGEDIFVIGNGRMRSTCQRFRGTLLDAFALIDAEPFVPGNDIVKWHGIVAELQSLFGGLQQSNVEVVVQLLSGGQRGAIDFFQCGEAFVEMLLAGGDACGRIVRPFAILSGIAHAGGEFRILFHPKLPIGVEIRAEILLCFCLRSGRRRLCDETQRS